MSSRRLPGSQKKIEDVQARLRCDLIGPSNFASPWSESEDERAFAAHAGQHFEEPINDACKGSGGSSQRRPGLGSSKGIEKQMKVHAIHITWVNRYADTYYWTPSCRMGKARFAYDGQVQDERIFKTTLRVPALHELKMIRMSVNDLHDKSVSHRARGSILLSISPARMSTSDRHPKRICSRCRPRMA